MIVLPPEMERDRIRIIEQLTLLNDMQQIRQHLYFSAAISYNRKIPKRIRRNIEVILFTAATLSFIMLIYIHVAFFRSRNMCLEEISDSWPRDGIVRVQIPPEGMTVPRIEWHKSWKPRLPIGPGSKHKEEKKQTTGSDTEESKIMEETKMVENPEAQSADSTEQTETQENKDRSSEKKINTTEEEVENQEKQTKKVRTRRHFMMEYSLEYGLLRIQDSTRQKLNISTVVVSLDPNKESCFGNVISRAILGNILDYDKVLLSSFELLSKKEGYNGYLLNVVTGEHYRFIDIRPTSESVVIGSIFMLLFTIATSMLIRFQHHQMTMMVRFFAQAPHVFVGDPIRILSLIVPLSIVLFAVLGLYAIVNDYFGDHNLTFFLILAVSLADYFHSLCCYSPASRKYWLRFFYLYLFSFYMYEYRFHGQFSGFALLTAWLYIVHSKVYFFHHYEIPWIMTQVIRNVQIQVFPPIPVR